MRYHVFTAAQNPATEKAKVHTSKSVAISHLRAGRAIEVGPRAIKMVSSYAIAIDLRELRAGGTARGAWSIRPSDGYLVWQLRTH